jgi:hypothetical protein
MIKWCYRQIRRAGNDGSSGTVSSLTDKFSSTGLAEKVTVNALVKICHMAV